MHALVTLAQSLGIAFASGISPYATVAFLGVAERLAWIDPLPGALHALSNPWVIALASTMAFIEFLATLVPGIASAWETAHSAVRPPAAAALAVLTAWHGDAALVLAAGLLGGGVGLTTHAAKLGVRYTIDASPEPVTNGVANLAELTAVASVSYFVWNHPFITLATALAILVALILTVRLVWRTMRRWLAAPLRRERLVIPHRD